MGYDVKDIINKAIEISINRKDFYKEIGDANSNIPSTKIMSDVLVKSMNKTILYYEDLKLQEIDEKIDFSIYDKISFLINEFNKKIQTPIPVIKSTRDFLLFSLDIETKIYALLIDIQGRLIKDSEDMNSKTYKTLSNMIENKFNLIDSIKKAVK